MQIRPDKDTTDVKYFLRKKPSGIVAWWIGQKDWHQVWDYDYVSNQTEWNKLLLDIMEHHVWFDRDLWKIQARQENSEGNSEE